MNPIAYVMTAKLNPGSYFDLGGVCALGVLLSLFLHVLLSAVFTLHEHVVRRLAPATDGKVDRCF